MKRKSMDETVNTHPTRRPQWPVDRLLEGLIGHDVRLAGESFSPVRWDGTFLPDFIPVRNLILPDNTRPDGLPVFFEGRLLQFERRIGVVFVALADPSCEVEASDGILLVRGATAVILRGPAMVRLAAPFRIERLPRGADNYWHDLRTPQAQFHWPW